MSKLYEGGREGGRVKGDVVENSVKGDVVENMHFTFWPYFG